MNGFPRRLGWQWYPLICTVGLCLGAPMASMATRESQGAGQSRITTALEILSHVPTGKELLKRAQIFWKLSRTEDLPKVFKWGRSSKTDAVLTRHFDPVTGTEIRERQVSIYLREDQKLEDLVLDIAHELVHATSRPAWDPYDPKLTAGKYIWAAIEGEGGEVDAVHAECRVGFELMDQFGSAAGSTERCEGYLSAQDDSLDREAIRRDFYRVGKWNGDISQSLGSERGLFPLMSAEVPALFSSTGNAPYPVALFREFEEITSIACENSRRRADAGGARSPASVQKSAQSFVAERCQKSLRTARR
jgi:hypothetical protein